MRRCLASWMSDVNWYPQHMLHATRDLERLLGSVDVIVEVRDARVPLSSAAHLVAPRVPRLVVLNKSDLADPHASARARDALGALLAVCGGPRKGVGVAAIMPAAAALAPRARGPLHVLVAGVPNVGKSSLLNALRGSRKAAAEGPTPGLTRRVGAFRVRRDPPVYVFDSPGVLAPASALDQRVARLLAVVGCVSTRAAAPERVLEWLLDELRAVVPDVDQRWSVEAVRARAGGMLDDEAAALRALKAFRSGDMGRFTLDAV